MSLYQPLPENPDRAFVERQQAIQRLLGDHRPGVN